jgi:hypothetical protein
MSSYEHVVDGKVTERVTTVDGSDEDTRLGVAALDRAPGADGWRIEGTVDPEPEQPADELSTPENPPDQTNPKPRAASPKPKTEKDE